MANGFAITKETWEHMPTEQRDWIVFETMQGMRNDIEKLKKRPVTDKLYSFAGGIVGGICAFFGGKII
jgi:hypothetical protein